MATPRAPWRSLRSTVGVDQDGHGVALESLEAICQIGNDPLFFVDTQDPSTCEVHPQHNSMVVGLPHFCDVLKGAVHPFIQGGHHRRESIDQWTCQQ